MYFILAEDVDNDRYYAEGELMSLIEFMVLVRKAPSTKAYAFHSLDAALEWNASQE